MLSNGNRTEWSTIQGVISGDYVPFDQSDYSLLVIGQVKSDSAVVRVTIAKLSRKDIHGLLRTNQI